MKLAQLQRRHPDFDPATLDRYALLFEGGAAMAKRIGEFLPRHDSEPVGLYRKRVKAATYLNYVSPIVNTFASWLLTSPPSVRVRESATQELPPWAAELKEHANGRQDLDSFLRRRLVEAFVARRSFWRVETEQAPEGMTLAEWQRNGLDRVELCPVPASSIQHWSCDDGRYAWLVVHESYTELASFDAASEQRVETWTLWSADAPPRRWRLVLDADKPARPEDDVPEVTGDPELPTVPGVPFVCLELPPELWVLNLIADPQVEILRKRCALSWAIDRTCFAMPVLYSNSKKRVEAMGAGYYLQLGEKDRLDWTAPPSTPFDSIAANIATLKDELYRVVNQMAAGVDNNAAAVGRSGESKGADASATEIILRALGLLVRDAAEQTFDLAAERLGVAERFSAAGCNSFNVADLATLMDTAESVKLLEIPSPTLEREINGRIARKALPDATADVLAKIDEELAMVAVAAVRQTPDAATDATDSTAAPTVDVAAPTVDATKVADLALNGAQVSSLLEIVSQATAGAIARESAAQMILTAFPSVDAAEAQRLLGPAGFEPAAPVAPAAQ